MKHCQRCVVTVLSSVAGMLLAASAFAADADVTGLVPTIWWDFETQPSASGLATANKGSASISFSNKGNASYAAGVTNGWALNTDGFSPYSAAGGNYSTAGNAFTVSAVMTLGTRANGVTLNVRCETAGKDLVIRRGAEAGSLVIGLGPQKAASTQFLNATFADGDTAFHLVSIVAELSGTSLYVDGLLVTNTTEFSLCSASGCASRMQFGERLSSNQSGEVQYGGLIDDLRIHDAALTPVQMNAIARDVGLRVDPDLIAVVATGGDIVRKDSFSTSWTLDVGEGRSAEAGLVYGTDAALTAPSTNALGTALSAGDHTASLAGLDPGTTYWWKIVASNGVNWAETPIASFRTPYGLESTAFAKRVPITISGYAGTSVLTDFPVLVRLAADSPTGFDYADCATDGSDLRFAKSDGTMLSHEIESWNTNGTSYVWVKVPSLSGTATAFDLFYGADPATLPAVDPTDVWTRYAVVIHGGSGLSDSSPKSLAVANGGGVVATADSGVVGGGIHKASRNSIGLNIPNPIASGTLTDSSQFTLTTWFRYASSGTACMTASKSGWWNSAGFLLICEGGSYMSVAVGGHQGTTGAGALVKNQWNHVAFSYATSGSIASLRTYFEGEVIHSTDSARTPADGGATYWTVGSYANTASDDSFVGDMDEIRLFDGIASADWIKAEYDSVTYPGTFAVLGPVESTDETIPRLGALAMSDENGTATFSVELALPGWGGTVPTDVSVFYGTDGKNWTEISLGSTNEAATLTATASGFEAGVRYVWYAEATATSGGTPKTATSAQRSFVAKAFDPVGYYKSFTATVVYDGESAENVPVPIRISEMGINGFSYDDVTASGFEILDAGGQLLPCEIDTWNTDGESILWTRLPVYENGATVTVRYGAPFANAPLPATNVWAGYAGVWHMNETYDGETAATGLSHDSSGNGLDATPTKGGSGNLAQMVSAPGVVGNARVNATSDTTSGNYLSVPNYDSLALGDTFAVSGWFKATIINGYPRLLSRKTAYNTDNGWELENGNGNAKAFSARGASGDAISLNTPSYDNAWVHIALVYNGTTLSAYANGAPCGSGTITAATDNGKPLSIGNNSNGSERSFPGLYDEIRLLDATPSAAWIAAEYHAMADGGAISFSSVSSSDLSAPVLGIPSVASNSDGSFTISVAVSENIPTTIFCTIDGNDYTMTTTDAALPATYSATVSNLPDGTHAASVHASSASGTTVSAACPTAFHAGALTVTVLANADEGLLSNGVFRISRADADPTGLPALTFDVALSGDGLAAIVDPGVSALTIPAGEGFVDFAITPALTDAVDEDAELLLAVSGTHIGQPSGATMEIVNATFDISVRYVSTTGDDSNPGGTPEKPKKTIGSAVTVLADVDSSKTCTVHVAPGLYPISSPISLTKAIRVLGDDTDPSRVVVSNTASGVTWGVSYRCFELNHSAARISGLTIQKGCTYGSGGNLFINSNGGTVSNCVIQSGLAREASQSGAGANVYVSGPGLVTHCAIFGGKFDQGGTTTGSSSVFLDNVNARLENCLVDGYRDQISAGTRRAAGVTVNKGRIVNCTVVNCYTTAETGGSFSGIRVETSGVATNCVSVKNVDGSQTLRAFLGQGSRTVNCAFDAIAGEAAIPEGMSNAVVGTAEDFFTDYANGDYTPSFSGPLANVGVDYEGMAAVDLAGKKRKAGNHIDIGCYECQKVKGFFILVQ